MVTPISPCRVQPGGVGPLFGASTEIVDFLISERHSRISEVMVEFVTGILSVLRARIGRALVMVVRREGSKT